MKKGKRIVNSWNEWDPLKHVIVGRADGTCIPAPEPALDAKVPEESDMRGNLVLEQKILSIKQISYLMISQIFWLKEVLKLIDQHL